MSAAPDSSSSPSAPPSGASSPEASPEASGNTRTKRWIGFGLAAAVLVALAIPKINASGSGSGSAPSQGQAAPTPVDVQVARTTSVVERLETTGTLRANESVELASESAGKVTDIRFQEGARVQQGQLLVQINDAELQAERTRLSHELDLARDRADRQEQLLARGGVSQEEYDATVNRVNVLEAQVALTEARIEKTQVRAPFPGRIGLRRVSEGSYLSPQTPIATLQSTNPIKLDLSVPEKYAARITDGQTITFTVRGSDRTFEGAVYAIEPQIDTATRTLRLRARADNADGALRPGMFADVIVRLGTLTNAITVPSFAVLPTLSAQRVFVAENGTAQPRNVTIGVRTDSTVQITDGLAPQDTVIVSRVQDLRAGLPIRIDRVEDAGAPALQDDPPLPSAEARSNAE